MQSKNQEQKQVGLLLYRSEKKKNSNANGSKIIDNHLLEKALLYMFRLRTY